MRGISRLRNLLYAALTAAVALTVAGCGTAKSYDWPGSLGLGSDDAVIETAPSDTEPQTEPQAAPATGMSDPVGHESAVYGRAIDWDDSYLWNPAAAPDYYIVTGPSSFDASAPASFGPVTSVDSMGRPNAASANISADMVLASAGEREDIADDPYGWPYENPRETIHSSDGSYRYSGWFWNRSHLVADSLGGHAVADNLVPGTRMQNTGFNGSHGAPYGGMAYEEKRVRDWFWDHIDAGDTSVWCRYAATPVYRGDERIPRAVVVEARTSDGSIDDRVVVYNTALGYDIDYSTGEVSPS